MVDHCQAKNTDREIWRGPDEGCGNFYADRIFVTEGGGIGINCGGYVIVKPVREWFALAAPRAVFADARITTGAVMFEEKKHWLMVNGPRSANEIVSDFWRPMTDHPLPVTRASVVELIEMELKRALEFGEAVGRDPLSK